MLWRMRGRGGGSRLRCRFRRVGVLLGFLGVAAFLVRFGVVGVGGVSRLRMCGGVVGAVMAEAHSLFLGRSGGLFGDSGGVRRCESSIAC